MNSPACGENAEPSKLIPPLIDKLNPPLTQSPANNSLPVSSQTLIPSNWISFSTFRDKVSVVHPLTCGPSSSLIETIASIFLSSSHVQFTRIGIFTETIPSLSRVEVQFPTSNSTIPPPSSTTEHESPLSQRNDGSAPCELSRPIVASVTLSTKSP